MSSYWKKKMDELNESESSKKDIGYWEKKIDELEVETKKKKTQTDSKKGDIAPVKTTKGDDITAPIQVSLTLPGYIKEKGRFDFKDYMSRLGGEMKEFLTDGEDGYDVWDNFGFTKKVFEHKEKETAERLVSGEKVSLGESVGNMVNAGLSSFNQSFTKTFDVILGKRLQELGWENNPISSIADLYDTQYRAYANRAQVDAKNKGKGWEIANEVGTATVAALPDALLAMMSFGASEGASLTTKAASLTGDFATKARIATMRMAKNPQYWLSFARSYGNDYERAMELTGGDELASTFGATLVSMLNAGVEVGPGGKSGIQGLPDSIANGGEKAIVSWVKSTLEESGEEVLQGVISRAAEKHLYGADEVNVLDPKQMLYEGAMGGAVGGLLGGGQTVVQGVVNATANAINEAEARKLTANEQAVVDKEVENRIAEQEKDGKKLTNREKAVIKQDVIRAMERGRITTDTIEEVLGGEEYSAYKREYDAFFGGETFKAYKDTVESEEAQIKENEPDTIGNRNKYNVLESQIEQIRNSAKRAELKAQLDSEATRIGEMRNNLRTNVSELVMGDRLYESYRELARSHEQFTADVSKYENEHARKTIQNIIDSGVAVNTNEFHEIADWLAKISADKEITFTTTNIERLKGTRYDIEGKIVDGFVDENGNITLNIDSPKATQITVGHEITHVLEGTEFYEELQSAIKNYAMNKMGLEAFNAKLKETETRYKGIGDPDRELTADLVGEYIFTDADFVKHLSVTNRNVFQKIYDEIKYLYKVATAGSKEARELEKVKKLFEQAYREGGKAQTDTKYSIGEIVDENNNSYGIGVHLDSTLLDNLTPDERKVMVKERIKELGGEVFTAYDNNGNAVNVTIAEPSARFKNQNGKKRLVNNDLTTKYIGNEVKQEAVVLIDELIETSEFKGTEPAKHPHGWLDNEGQNDWDVWTTYIQDKNNTIWEATLHIANTANGEKIIYDVDPTKKVGQSGNSDTSLLNDRIPQSGENVKLSLSDSDGKQLSKEQQEFFKDSKIRDENGNLLVMYHGTKKGGFTVFQNTRRPNTEGFYFTNDKKYSYEFEGRKANGQFYPSTKEGIEAGYYNPQRYKVYLDVKNPLVLTADQQDIIEDIGYWEHIYKPIKDAGYDGVMMEDMSQVFVFNSNQIKSTANAKPTADKDIRYSLSDSKGREISPAVQKRFANSKVVDEDGNLKAVFHGTTTGEFSIFDKSKGNVEGDFGSGFYFTDNEADVSEHYEGGGPDFDNKVARLAEQIESEEEIDYEEAEKKAREQLYKGSHKFEVYLNIENPAIVGETMLFDPDNYFSQYNEEDYDSYEDYEADVDQLFSDDIENIIWDIERNVDIYSTDGIAEVLWEAVSEGGIGLEEIKAKLNNLYLEDSEGNLVGNEVARQIIESLGFDGIIDPTVSGKWNMDIEDGTTHYIVFKPNQIKSVTNENPTDNPDIHRSLSNVGETPDNHGLAPLNKFKYSQTYGKDIRLETAENAAPIQEGVAENATTTDGRLSELGERRDQILNRAMELDRKKGRTEEETFEMERLYRQADALMQQIEGTVEDLFPDNLAPVDQELDRLVREQAALEAQLQEMVDRGKFSADEWDSTNAKWQEVVDRIAELEAEAKETDAARVNSLDDADVPPERYAEAIEQGNQMAMPKNVVNMIAQNVKASLYVPNNQMGEVHRLIEDYSKQEFPSRDQLFQNLKDSFGTYSEKVSDEAIQEVKGVLRKYRLNVSDQIKNGITDYAYLRRQNFGKVLFSRQGTPVDVAYEELSGMYPSFFPKDIINPTDQLLQIIDVANRSHTTERTYSIEDETLLDVADDIIEAVHDYQYTQREQEANNVRNRSFGDLVQHEDDYAPMPEAASKPANDIQGSNPKTAAPETQAENNDTDGRQTRKQLHQNIVDGIKETFKAKGFDFDRVLKKAKNLSTFSTVDNTPQRVMEKALGYKEGQVLSDITVNKVAQNETEGIKWLNSFTDRKSGLLKQFSDQYHIKPGSKESAAAQMYAEGFYVAENNDIVGYGDAELAQDFPDAKVRANIKALARDPRIRQIYDDTLDMINESRTRNAYPAIQKLDNYFLHFRAMDDTFSKLGLPFNPNDIRAKDLPTDLNGVTADLKPGQPYFASAMHRTGKRTSFDLLGGLERYLTSAKNQIYHIDDIQTMRALRNYIADTYGQANGLEGLDALSEEEAQERIEKVYNSHLSTFAKFLNEEANILAGKTALIDRGLEGILGRRGMTFLDTVNKQVGSNMVGFNVSSSLTNFLPVAQTFAKTNKFDFVKAFAQTVGNKVGSVFGRTDGFAENSPVIIRRKGADRFYRTPWQKAGDAGYVLMSAVDDISTELIARTKFNELTRNGMDAQKAHYETDKWVSRLMGDRSLGQMPQIYNSKMLGLVTKFQLEVRNQLDSQFYDTIQEAKVSNEHIENGIARNAKTAAKVASTFVQLAVVQHLFGKAFESVAGYNPAFDIIEVLMTAFGFDDEEDSEDTVLDNIEQGFLALLEDLPYTSTFTGGRIPISAALPISELVKGEDEWGNEKSRWETLGEIAPYYVLPSGYGQIKKTKQGLDMFSNEHPIAGSYTDSGNLRFPVEDNLKNRVQAGIFGQWASENARTYFNNNLAPLDEKRTQEYSALGLSYDDYWAYRDEISEIAKRAEKTGASDEDILMTKYYNSVGDDLASLYKEGKTREYDALARERYNSFSSVTIDGDYANVGDRWFKKDDDGEWKKLNDDQVTKYLTIKDVGNAHYATNGTVHYRLESGGDPENMGDWTKISEKDLARQREVTRELGITPEEYWSKTETSFIPMKKGEYEYAYDNPGSYAIAKAVGGYDTFKSCSDEINNIKANNDSDSGIKDKDLVREYIFSLDIDDGQKAIMYRSLYNNKDDRAKYNNEIIDYLNSRDDISFDEMVAILRKLGFDVTDDGHISW